MDFAFNNTKYSFPTSLSKITLRQKIDFENLYGKDLTQKYNSIVGEIEEKDLNAFQNLELSEHRLDVACKNFSFFSGIPLDDVRKINIDQILSIYQSCFEQLHKQEQEIKLENKYLWDDEYWIIENPELSYSSEMTFNEFVTAKQTVKDFYDLGQGNWDSLPYLCAIYFRKEDEEFSENLISENSERIKLMYELPLDIALGVAFFLAVSMSIYMKRLPFSQEIPAEETTAQT